MSEPDRFALFMDQGVALHASGQTEQALVAFEKALALQPENANAASACATLLTALEQPLAAYEVLATLRQQLLEHPDGAANMAIAAEACGKVDEARAAYARALELDPDHVRSLNNTALMLARDGQWPEAIEKLERCLALVPADPRAWLNLVDMLIAARRFEPALRVIGQAVDRFPQEELLRIRHALVLAFDGQIEAAQQAIDALGTSGKQTFQQLVANSNSLHAMVVRSGPTGKLDAYDLFCKQVFDAMQQCDWRDHDRLMAVIREMLGRAARTGIGRDWRDTQFYGLMLPLHEDEMAQMRVLSIDCIGKALSTPLAPFVASRSRQRDDRIHVGLAIQSLRDPRFANGLQQQLQLHDRSRFAIHVYCPTPQPDLALTGKLAGECASAIDIAHMSNDEAVARIRLDELDLFVDMAFDTPWCRPEIPQRRVAPVQIRQTTWHRHHPSQPCEYNMSDLFVHPPELDLEPYGAIVRLPHTCWLATNEDQPEAPAPTRVALGLPEQGLVLCALLPALMIDPQSFALWMAMLRQLPGAVLWLPSYSASARANLGAATHAAGIDTRRVLFMQPCTRSQMLARIAAADLFVDTLRFNANHGLVDALRMGVPAVSCAGQSMASRLGGSIVRAAGLADCVVGTPKALMQKVIQLGTTPAELASLRLRLAQAATAAPLFDRQSRVREWEDAWTTMVERHRSGQAPEAFDVPERRAAAVDATLSRRSGS